VIGDGRQQALRPRRASGGPRRPAASARGARGLRRGLRRLPRPGPRLLAAVAVALALAAGGWVWLRSSPLVAVQQVTVAGVSGPDASQIRSALTAAAESMTTLNVKMAALRTAVAPYPVVRQLHVITHFPHRMRIDVVEQVPVAMIDAAGRQMAVSADGTLLHDATITSRLPTIALAVAPGGTHVAGGTLSVIKLLSAAPYALLAKVGQASDGGVHGLTAQLRDGPKVYFGEASRLSAKWAAVAAVLAGPNSPGADYIDVTVPSRPVAGAGSDTASAPSSASAPAGSSGVPSSGSTGSSALQPGGATDAPSPSNGG
jgi:cell division protein FtsQ